MCSHGILILPCHRHQILQEPQKGSPLLLAQDALDASLIRSYPPAPLLSSQLPLPWPKLLIKLCDHLGGSLPGEKGWGQVLPLPSGFRTQPIPEGRRSASSPDTLPLALLHLPSPPLNKEFEPLLLKAWTTVEITSEPGIHPPSSRVGQ